MVQELYIQIDALKSCLGFWLSNIIYCLLPSMPKELKDESAHININRSKIHSAKYIGILGYTINQDLFSHTKLKLPFARDEQKITDRITDGSTMEFLKRHNPCLLCSTC